MNFDPHLGNVVPFHFCGFSSVSYMMGSKRNWRYLGISMDKSYIYFSMLPTRYKTFFYQCSKNMVHFIKRKVAGLHVHFVHHHVWDTVIIMEEGNLT